MVGEGKEGKGRETGDGVLVRVSPGTGGNKGRGQRKEKVGDTWSTCSWLV